VAEAQRVALKQDEARRHAQLEKKRAKKKAQRQRKKVLVR
jgi:hypothetical protein